MCEVTRSLLIDYPGAYVVRDLENPVEFPPNWFDRYHANNHQAPVSDGAKVIGRDGHLFPKFW